MYDQEAQDYISELTEQSDYVIINGLRLEWQMMQEMEIMVYILRHTVIVKDLGYIHVMSRLNSTFT